MFKNPELLKMVRSLYLFGMQSAVFFYGYTRINQNFSFIAVLSGYNIKLSIIFKLC
jgi:hypothetical protein